VHAVLATESNFTEVTSLPQHALPLHVEQEAQLQQRQHTMQLYEPTA